MAGGRRRRCALPRGRAALTERLGRSVVVENRPGAGSVIGTAAGAKASPDGYTMVMAGSGSLAISATMYKKLPYDPVKDFVPMVLGAKIPFVLVVTPSLPVHSVAELVTLREGKPRQAVIRIGRARLAPSSLRRIAQEHDRHRDDSCALQRQCAGADRRDRRPCAAVVLRHRSVAAADPGGKGAGTGRVDRRPPRHPRPKFRPSPRPAFPASTLPAGACSRCRPGRRRRP